MSRRIWIPIAEGPPVNDPHVRGLLRQIHSLNLKIGAHEKRWGQEESELTREYRAKRYRLRAEICNYLASLYEDETG